MSNHHPSAQTPQHVVIIPDGNRRWAKEHHLSVLEGHKYVAEKIFPRLISHAIKKNISYLTFWVFSRDNWQRSQNEVDGLMDIFRNLGMKKLVDDAHQQHARIRLVGDIHDFDSQLQKSLLNAEIKTQHNTALTLIIALSYSGRNEIVRAMQSLLLESPHLSPTAIDEQLISQHLDTADFPDPDLIIRTSGEQRLSGLFPWQSIYSELYFTQTKMPDFTEKEFDLALEEYARRQRRFGS